MASEVLKIYGDRISQPFRAVIILCKINGIEFEEVEIKIPTTNIQHPEFQAINPLKKVPAIAHGNFTLFESHAILTYLASWYQVPDHWYPGDLRKRAKIQSVLDWHHSNLRYGATTYLKSTIWASLFGKSPNAVVAAECEQKVIESCSTIETLWLQGDSKFLLGNDQPSLADLALVCEFMELYVLSDEELNKMIGPFKKVQQWIENVKEATNPCFDEVHQQLYDAIASSKNKV